MSLPLITSSKLSATNVTGKWLLSCVCADVRSQVVAPAEVPHANAALEWFLSRVDADVPR